MRYLIAILLGLLAAGCGNKAVDNLMSCLLYTSDAADD